MDTVEVPSVNALKEKYQREIGEWAKAIEKLPFFRVNTDHDAVLNAVPGSLFECYFPISRTEVILAINWGAEVDDSGFAYFKMGDKAVITYDRACVKLSDGEQPLTEVFEGTWAEVYQRLLDLSNQFRYFGIPSMPALMQSSS